MGEVNQKEFVAYGELHTACRCIADQILAIPENLRPSLLVGVVRGGTVPATIISHMTGIDMEAITWQTRDGGTQYIPRELDAEIDHGRRVLFVDDINDTGKTFNEIQNTVTGTWTNCTYAALYEKNHSDFKLDFLPHRVIESNIWIVFPFEQDNAAP